MFVIKAWNRACPSYYNYNSRFDDRSSSILFRLPDKRLDVLKYFALYKYTLRLDTDPVKTIMGFHSCEENDWVQTAVRDEFMSYNLETREVIGLEAETIPANK